MKPFILVADGFDKNLFKELCGIEGLEVHPESKVDKNGLTNLLPKINGIIIRSATTINEDLLEKAPNLKLVIRAGEGTDNIDKIACGSKGVKVSNTPGANNNSAAEHALALMMTVLRQTALANKSMSDGKWDKNSFMGMELWKKKVGIVGMGRIGRILAKRLSGFEVSIFYYDPHHSSVDLPNTTKVDNIEDLFKNCDIISVHVPLIESTKDLVDKKLLELMKPNAIIINAARGGIVSESDLLDALKNNKIRGAGLDVFSQEPLPENSPLRNLPNLVLTPHLGATTLEAQERVGEMAVEQIKEFFLNNNLLNEVRH
jgi:D-3-phosphoglycerate dehydrogenase